MLHRKTAEGLLCITQPTHAWVAGQLARAWGNETFGAFAPWEEVCLGAEQHDIGWLPWEAAPTLNPTTGYPHSFSEIPTAVSVGIWTGAKDFAMPLGRYAALLVSLHGTGLFHRFTHWQQSSEASALVQMYLQQEEVFQQRLIETLKIDPAYTRYATSQTIDRNRQLIATWDALSLLICMKVTEPRQVKAVPMAAGEIHLTLTPIENDPTRLTVEPWAFSSDRVTVVVEGRLLQDSFAEEDAMQQALTNAPWRTITTTLTPA